MEFTSTVSLAHILTTVAALGMALTLGDINQVLRKMRGDSRKAGTSEIVRAFKAHMNQIGNPDLQIVEYSALNSADAVIANVGCRLYFLYGKKPAASTVDAWLKGSNHATVAAANGDVVAYYRGTSGGGKEHALMFADGLELATGLTLGCHTTVNGNTKSDVADAVVGFAVIGAL